MWKPKVWRPKIESLLTVYAPLSRVSIPLLNGLGRKRLLRKHVEQKLVRLDGLAINYYYKAARDGNTDLPILLVHGIADNALTWSFVFNSLTYTHSVYALDLPGYGFSGLPGGRAYTTLDEMSNVLARFVREVVGRPALVVGNSMGGWLAIKLAWSAPECVRGIILLNAGGAPLQGRASWEPFGEAIGMRESRDARLAFRQMFGGIPAPLLYLGQKSLQELFQRPVVREFVASMVAVDDADAMLLSARDLRELPVPAGLIWGLNDRFLPVGSLEFFRENLADAPTLLLTHCGHLPQRERPRSVLRFIRAFAADLPKQPHEHNEPVQKQL